ncbi:MAG: hypothetical protein KAS23_15890 [Anaerohalosphaera sp.]|nr:hypothetical protein [Anaerohalosphaera sp.]
MNSSSQSTRRFVLPLSVPFVWCLFFLSFSVCLAQPVYIPAPPGYDLTEPVALNNSGQVVGTALYEEEIIIEIWDPMTGELIIEREIIWHFRGFLWHNGSYTDLGSWHPIDINDSGQILCKTSYWGSPDFAIWQGGAVTNLPLERAGGINNSGQVSGMIDGKPCIWDNGSVTYLAGSGSYIVGGVTGDINSSGEVVGISLSSPRTGCKWGSLGAPQSLGSLDNGGSTPFAINDDGAVVGQSWLADGSGHGDVAFIWELGSGIRWLQSPRWGRFTDSCAIDINKQGKVVGFYGEAHLYGVVACMWQNDMVIDLNILPGCDELDQAVAINDSGWILCVRGVTGIFGDTYLIGPVTMPTTVIDGVYRFVEVNTDDWVDPLAAEGFRYVMTGTSLFTDILEFPTGFDQPFTVIAEDTTLGSFSNPDALDFVALLGHGVSEFTITGITPVVDSENPMAFPIRLRYDTPKADFDMIAIRPLMDLAGDDGLVNLLDFAVFSEQWLVEDEGLSADIDLDGIVSLSDFCYFAKDWLNP